MLDKYLRNLTVEVEPFALCLLDMGWRLSLPGPAVAMLHFVVQGSGWLIMPDGTRSHVDPSMLAVIPRGAAHALETEGRIKEELRIDCAPAGPPVHRIQAGGTGPLDMVVACGTLNVRYGSMFGLFDHLSAPLLADLADIPEVPFLFQSIIADADDSKPGATVLRGAAMTQLLVHMFRKLEGQSRSILPWLAALDDRRLAAALDAIMREPGAPHTVESLADLAHMSRSAFAKAFHDAFDRSPISMLNHLRMQKAAQLLESGSYNIKQVANTLGFASRSHFSRAFKNHTGMSPAAFRRETGA